MERRSVKENHVVRLVGAIVPAAIVVTLLAVIVLPAESPVRAASGLILLLILPGAAVVNALLPELHAAEYWMVLAISAGLSLAVTSTCALVLILLGVSLAGPAVPTTVAGASLVISVTASLGRASLPSSSRRRGGLALWAALLLVAGTLAAIWIGRLGDPVAEPPFTVFSAVGPNGTAESLMGASCEGMQVILAITSHEQRALTYELWQQSGGQAKYIKTIRLTPTESTQVALTLPTSPLSGKVTFELRLPGDPTPYRSLSLCAGT